MKNGKLSIYEKSLLANPFKLACIIFNKDTHTAYIILLQGILSKTKKILLENKKITYIIEDINGKEKKVSDYITDEELSFLKIAKAYLFTDSLLMATSKEYVRGLTFLKQYPDFQVYFTQIEKKTIEITEQQYKDIFGD